MVGREPFIVPDGAPVTGDPRQGPLHHPPAGQDLECVQVIGPLDDWEPQVQAGAGPGDQLPGVAPSAQACLMEGKARLRFHSSGFAASRSCTDAAVTRTVSSRPIVSTTRCRLVPLTFLPAS